MSVPVFITACPGGFRTVAGEAARRVAWRVGDAVSLVGDLRVERFGERLSATGDLFTLVDGGEPAAQASCASNSCCRSAVIWSRMTFSSTMLLAVLLVRSTAAGTGEVSIVAEEDEPAAQASWASIS